MKDRRTQFFFWLGVFILPVFWSWFTVGKEFTRRERVIAFLWMASFLGWALLQRSEVARHWEEVSVVYPAILGWVTVALAVWLIFRLGLRPATIIELIVFIDVIAIIRPSTFFVDRYFQPFHWLWAAAPLAVALLHLAVEPLQRLARRISDPPDGSAHGGFGSGE